MLDLQKASLTKRISAYILDFILLCVLAVGFASLISLMVDFDGHYNTFEGYCTAYEEQYHIDLDITEEAYQKLSDDEKAVYAAANEAFGKDPEVSYAYTLLVNLSLVIVSLGVFFAYMILEFTVPLLLGNGQTVGKKVFALALMRTDGVRVTAVQLFVRTALGKYAIETMIPVLLGILILLNAVGIIAPTIIFGLLIIQLGCVMITKSNSAIHDLLASTVAVDMASQMIFDSSEAMIAYKQKLQAEKAQNAPY